MKKIGTKKSLGIITCCRPDFFKEILDTTPMGDIDKVYVFDASPPDKKHVELSKQYTLISESDTGATVGVAKNRLLSRMKEDGYDHLFLQEDDVKIINSNIFDVYIDTACEYGLWGSLNYAWHGNGNFDGSGIPKLKHHLEKNAEIGIDFTHHGTASFSYIHNSIIDKFGYHDEFYQNCWEHLDFYQKQNLEKMASYWWWFTDVKQSFKYLVDLDGGFHKGSVIRKDEEWQKNMVAGVEHFKGKYKFEPNDMPEKQLSEVLELMDYIKENFGLKG